MASVSRLTQLQDRLAARGSRLHINQIVEQSPGPDYDSVGLELRAHRERKGHELDLAARVLRIKKAHICAIEESRFADLPGKTYAIGFVRSYAEYLGLNPSDCIRRFKREYDAAMNAGRGDGGGQTRSKLSFPNPREEVRLPHGSMIILASILVLGVWGGWYLTTSAEQQFNDAETVALPPENLPTPEDAEAILRAANGGIPADAVADADTAGGDGALVAAADNTGIDETSLPDGPVTPAEQMVAALTGTSRDAPPGNDIAEAEIEVNDPSILNRAVPREAQVFGGENGAARVIIRARGNAWVRIEGPGGAVLFEETLQRGDRYRVPNRGGLILATRNAGAVELMLDGQSLGLAGSAGEPLLDLSLDAAALTVPGEN